MFKSFRPIIRTVLGPRIIKKRLNSLETESKIPCDKIYHSEKYKKLNEKLEGIENRMIDDTSSHSEEYEKINKKLKEIDNEASWASFNSTMCLIVLLIKSY